MPYRTSTNSAKRDKNFNLSGCNVITKFTIQSSPSKRFDKKDTRVMSRTRQTLTPRANLLHRKKSSNNKIIVISDSEDEDWTPEQSEVSNIQTSSHPCQTITRQSASRQEVKKRSETSINTSLYTSFLDPGESRTPIFTKPNNDFLKVPQNISGQVKSGTDGLFCAKKLSFSTRSAAKSSKPLSSFSAVPGSQSATTVDSKTKSRKNFVSPPTPRKIMDDHMKMLQNKKVGVNDDKTGSSYGKNSLKNQIRSTNLQKIPNDYESVIPPFLAKPKRYSHPSFRSEVKDYKPLSSSRHLLQRSKEFFKKESEKNYFPLKDKNKNILPKSKSSDRKQTNTNSILLLGSTEFKKKINNKILGSSSTPSSGEKISNIEIDRSKRPVDNRSVSDCDEIFESFKVPPSGAQISNKTFLKVKHNDATVPSSVPTETMLEDEAIEDLFRNTQNGDDVVQSQLPESSPEIFFDCPTSPIHSSSASNLQGQRSCVKDEDSQGQSSQGSSLSLLEENSQCQNSLHRDQNSQGESSFEQVVNHGDASVLENPSLHNLGSAREQEVVANCETSDQSRGSGKSNTSLSHEFMDQIIDDFINEANSQSSNDTNNHDKNVKHAKPDSEAIKSDSIKTAQENCLKTKIVTPSKNWFETSRKGDLRKDLLTSSQGLPFINHSPETGRKNDENSKYSVKSQEPKHSLNKTEENNSLNHDSSSSQEVKKPKFTFESPKRTRNIFPEVTPPKRRRTFIDIEQNNKKMRSIIDSFLDDAKQKSKEKRMEGGSPLLQKATFASPPLHQRRLGLLRNINDNSVTRMLKTYKMNQPKIMEKESSENSRNFSPRLSSFIKPALSSPSLNQQEIAEKESPETVRNTQNLSPRLSSFIKPALSSPSLNQQEIAEKESPDTVRNTQNLSPRLSSFIKPALSSASPKTLTRHELLGHITGKPQDAKIKPSEKRTLLHQALQMASKLNSPKPDLGSNVTDLVLNARSEVNTQPVIETDSNDEIHPNLSGVIEQSVVIATQSNNEPNIDSSSGVTTTKDHDSHEIIQKSSHEVNLRDYYIELSDDDDDVIDLTLEEDELNQTHKIHQPDRADTVKSAIENHEISHDDQMTKAAIDITSNVGVNENQENQVPEFTEATAIGHDNHELDNENEIHEPDHEKEIHKHDHEKGIHELLHENDNLKIPTIPTTPEDIFAHVSNILNDALSPKKTPPSSPENVEEDTFVQVSKALERALSQVEQDVNEENEGDDATVVSRATDDNKLHCIDATDANENLSITMDGGDISVEIENATEDAMDMVPADATDTREYGLFGTTDITDVDTMKIATNDAIQDDNHLSLVGSALRETGTGATNSGSHVTEDGIDVTKTGAHTTEVGVSKSGFLFTEGGIGATKSGSQATEAGLGVKKGHVTDSDISVSKNTVSSDTEISDHLDDAKRSVGFLNNVNPGISVGNNTSITENIEQQVFHNELTEQDMLENINSTEIDEMELQTSKSNIEIAQDDSKDLFDDEEDLPYLNTPKRFSQNLNSNDDFTHERKSQGSMFDIDQFFDDLAVDDSSHHAELEMNDGLPEVLYKDENVDSTDVESDNETTDLLDELPDITETPRSKKRRLMENSPSSINSLDKSEKMMSQLLNFSIRSTESSQDSPVDGSQLIRELDELSRTVPRSPRNPRKRERSSEAVPTLGNQPSYSAILVDTNFSRTYKKHGPCLKKLVKEKQKQIEIDKMEKILLSELKEGGFRETLERAEVDNEEGSTAGCDEETKKAIDLMKEDWGTLPNLSSDSKIFKGGRLEFCQHNVELRSYFNDTAFDSLEVRKQKIVSRMTASTLEQHQGFISYLLDSEDTRTQTYKWILQVLQCHPDSDMLQRIIQSSIGKNISNQSAFNHSNLKSVLIGAGIEPSIFGIQSSQKILKEDFRPSNICPNCLRKRKKPWNLFSIVKVFSIVFHNEPNILNEFQQLEFVVFLLLLLQDGRFVPWNPDIVQVLILFLNDLKNWNTVKFLIVRRFLKQCSRLNTIQEVCMRLHFNAERLHELSKIISFAVLKLNVFVVEIKTVEMDDFYDMEALIEIVDHLNPANLELLLPGEDPDSIGSQKRSYYHLSLLLPLLNICIGDECKDINTMNIIERITSILRTMNKRIRDNGAIYRSQVKYELSLFTKNMRFLIQKAPRTNKASIFKYLRAAPVQEQVIDNSFNNLSEDESSENEADVSDQDDDETDVKGQGSKFKKNPMMFSDVFDIAEVMKSRIIGSAGKG